jgi:hypothetical protein
MKIIRSTRLPRRSFLTAAGAGVGHMFLRPLVAEAQGVIPQRLLMIHRPCGTWPDDFLDRPRPSAPYRVHGPRQG